MPARPANVIGSPPIATPSRVISARPPSHHRGARVVAGTDAIGHTRSDGDDVLQHASHLGADHVAIDVHAEQVAREDVLQLARDEIIRHGDDRSGGLPCEDLLGEVRSREHARPDARGAPRAPPGSSAASSPASRPLVKLTTGNPRPQPLRARLERLAEAVRRHTHHEQVREADGFFERARGSQIAMELVTVEILAVVVVAVDLVGQVGAAGPQRRRRVVRRKMSDRRAPGAGADDRYSDRHASRLERKPPSRNWSFVVIRGSITSADSGSARKTNCAATTHSFRPGSGSPLGAVDDTRGRRPRQKFIDRRFVGKGRHVRSRTAPRDRQRRLTRGPSGSADPEPGAVGVATVLTALLFFRTATSLHPVTHGYSARATGGPPSYGGQATQERDGPGKV